MGKAERWLCVVAALVGGVVGGAFAGRIWPLVAAFADTNSAQVVTAQKFVLVDQSGKQRAVLDSEPGGAAFMVLFDRGGKRRLGLGAETKGAALNLFDADGTTLRAALRIRPDGASEVLVEDGRGQPRSGLAVSALGNAEQP